MKLNKILVVGVVGFLLVCLFTFKKDKEREEYVLKDRIEVNDSYNSIAMYQVDGEEEKKITEMPEGNYTIDTQRSYCVLKGEKEHDKEAILKTNENGEHIISNLAPEERCFVWFNKIIKAGDTIIDNSSVIGDEAHFDKTSCVTGCDVQENGLYKAKDDFGESYYFRGSVSDNWVKFGKTTSTSSGEDIWWRIIRINGDGSIRLIYAGTGETAENLTPSDETNKGYVGSSNSQINNNATTVWAVDNKTYNNNMYVGYEWISGKMHGYGSGSIQSMVLQNLNTWFETNLSDEFANGEGQIDIESIFCNDRSGATGSGATWSEDMEDSGGIGSNDTYYGAHKRLVNKQNPTLKCSTNYTNSSNPNGVINKTADSFTYTGAKTGTKSLEYPVGLITADEVVYAGGLSGYDNKGYWLYTGKSYWTMSPCQIRDGAAYIFLLDLDGRLSTSFVHASSRLRPVINLKADTKFYFDHADKPKGTSDNPYIVSN